ncbi:MAG: ABC transporter permease [Christensenellaceae bacterium]|nr:ABC transporter permease [Christensenellaceae bacterium]
MKKVWAILLVLCLGLIAYFWVQVANIPGVYQYIEQNPNVEEIDLEVKYTGELTIQNAAVSLAKASTGAELHAVSHDYFDSYHAKLIEGRYFYRGEEANVAIIDKQIALVVSGSESALGKEILINQEKYKVVGIIDSAAQENFTKNVYIPFVTAVKAKTKADLLIYTCNPNFFDVTEFNTKFTQNVWNLPKEKQRATLIVKFVIFLYGLITTTYVLRIFKKWLSLNFKKIKALLVEKYPSQIPLQITGHVLSFICGFGVIAASYGFLMYFIVEALLQFPEWVPEILVDFDMIKKTYINNVNTASKLVVLRTPQVVMLNSFQRIINILSTLSIFSFSTIIFNRKGNKAYD